MNLIKESPKAQSLKFSNVFDNESSMTTEGRIPVAHQRNIALEFTSTQRAHSRETQMKARSPLNRDPIMLQCTRALGFRVATGGIHLINILSIFLQSFPGANGAYYSTECCCGTHTNY